MKLLGKKALVTGSNQGIGQTIAIRLAEEGADVVIDYVTHPETADETVQSVLKLGRKAVAVRGDLSNVADTQQMVRESVDALGGLDILVNNAGVEKNASFWEVTEADYDFVLNINLKGAFFATQAFARHRMEMKQPGKVINISSVHEDLRFRILPPIVRAREALR
jgi:glucose 1-dehydrogenase